MTFPTFEQLQFTPTASASGCVKTQTITDCKYERDTLTTVMDHPQTWPCVLGPFDPANMVYANQWFIVQQPDGVWLAGISEYLRGSDNPPYRQGEKLVTQPIAGDPHSPEGTPEGSQFYARDRWGALCDWRPYDGQVIGVFVTTQLRGGELSPIRERSNMVFLRLSVENGTIMSTTVAGVEGGTVTPPVDPPVPPVDPPVPPQPPVGATVYVGAYGTPLEPAIIKASGVAGKMNLCYAADGAVVSVAPNGTIDTRPAGTDGPWEQATLQTGCAVYLVDEGVLAVQVVQA